MKKYTLIFTAMLLLFAFACKQDQSGQAEEAAAAEPAAADTTTIPTTESGVIPAELSRYVAARAGLRFSYPQGSTIMDNGNLITVKLPPPADGAACSPSSLQIVVEENCTKLAFSETGGASVKTSAGKEKFGLYEFIKGYGEVNGEKAYSFKTLQDGKCFTLTFFGNCALEAEGVLKASKAEDIVRTFRAGS